MENKKEILIKNLKFYFEILNKLFTKKDKFYSEFRVFYSKIKQNELTDIDTKSLTEMILMSLETNNLRIFEKCVSFIESLMSHELLDPKIFPNIVTQLLNHLFDKSSQNDDNVNYKILNLCLVLYTNKKFVVNGANILLIVRICLFIFLTSLNPTCQNIAKITLIQILDYFLEKTKTYFLKNSLNLSKTLDLNNEVEKDHQIEDSINSKKFISKLLNHYLDIIEIDSLNDDQNKEHINGDNIGINGDKNVNFFSQYVKFMYNNPEKKEIESLFNDVKIVNKDTKNELGYVIGTYGWCANCRKTSKYFSYLIKFPVCSGECEIKMFGNEKIIEIDEDISETIKDDFVNIFKCLSILSVKEIKETPKLEKINIRLRIFCLNLMQKMIIKNGIYFINNNQIIQIIREYTMDSLVKNSMSNDVDTLEISLNLFCNLMTYFKEYLKDQIEIFINKLF